MITERRKLKIQSSWQFLFLIVGLIAGQANPAMNEPNPRSISTDSRAETEGSMDSPDLRSVSVPTDASDPEVALRRGIAISVGDSPISPNRAARNLLISFILLIAIIFAGTVTIRDILTAHERPGRSCPLDPCLNRMKSSVVTHTSKYDDECLDDAPIDWDKILLSSKLTCVFDPSSLSIGNLLALPPPSFKSKVDFVSAVNYLNRLGFGGESRQVAMDDISIVRGIGAAPDRRISQSSETLEDPEMDIQCWKGLEKMSIKSLFPVQKICTDLILKRFQNPQYSPYDCDLCVSAPTGSGKSLAYLLPIIHGLVNRKHHVLRALIVLPTRDLAMQVAGVADNFKSEENRLKINCLVGQASMAEERGLLTRSPPDIAVATIGRLVDHLVIGSLDLSYLRWLVVDEADRMLSKTDLDKWSLILKSVPDTTQRLLFSATMTSNPMKLSKLNLTRPLFVSVGNATLPETITHKYVVVPNKSMKVRCLIKVLQMIFDDELVLVPEPAKRCLILCRTTANVQSLFSLLKSFYQNSEHVIPSAFSGNLSGKHREKLLSKFGKSAVNCLVSTDVITRGIDIPDIDVVINYDMPNHSTTYIHRAGRTGRANKKGLVITFAESKEMRHFRREIIGSNEFLKGAISRIALDFSTVMTHDDLENIVDAEDEQTHEHE